MGFSEQNSPVPERFLPSKHFILSALNIASGFLAGDSLGIMDFLLVQVGMSFLSRQEKMLSRFGAGG